MRHRLESAPWWALSLLHGAYFGVFMTLVLRTQGLSWRPAAIGGAVAGLLFGAIVGPLSRRLMDRSLAAVGDLSPERRRVAGRAALRGPVPADPEVREDARRLAAHARDEVRRQRTFNTLAFGAFTVLGVYLAITSSPWFWLSVLVFVLFAVLSPVYAWHLERRIARLADAPDARDGTATTPRD